MKITYFKSFYAFFDDEMSVFFHHHFPPFASLLVISESAILDF